MSLFHVGLKLSEVWVNAWDVNTTGHYSTLISHHGPHFLNSKYLTFFWFDFFVGVTTRILTLNIVEFYGVSLLFSIADKTLQLFLELMPRKILVHMIYVSILIESHVL